MHSKFYFQITLKAFFKYLHVRPAMETKQKHLLLLVKAILQRLRQPSVATTQAQFGEENSLLKGKGDEDGDWDAEGMESIYRSTMLRFAP
jgi:hypothetical protein